MQCHAMCKIEFHDQRFRKMKKSNGIAFFKFSIEKVLKKYGKWFLKMCGNPACGVNGLTSFICLWCHTTTMVGRKVRFHHTLPFMTKQRDAVRLQLPLNGPNKKLQHCLSCILITNLFWRESDYFRCINKTQYTTL